jgi:hypothetical protein
MPGKLVSGLDLGKVADFSALAVLERTKLDKPVAKRRFRYSLRHLETWDLGTRYTSVAGGKSIIGDVRKRFDTPQLRWTPLAVDQTGVGNAVVDIIRAARVPARITPVVITSGHAITVDKETGETHVPKKELVSTLVVLLEGGLMKWAHPGTPGALALIARFERELSDFRLRVTKSRHETFGADASQHDDLVLAVALAAWLGEHRGCGDLSGMTTADPATDTVLAGAPDGTFATSVNPNPEALRW